MTHLSDESQKSQIKPVGGIPRIAEFVKFVNQYDAMIEQQSPGLFAPSKVGINVILGNFMLYNFISNGGHQHHLLNKDLSAHMGKRAKLIRQSHRGAHADYGQLE